MKNRFIFDHVWEARGAWEAMEEGLFVSIDFSKAFDPIHHNYFRAFFSYLGLPVTMIALLLSMLTSPFAFGVGKGIVPSVLLHPQSGVRQGDPLSPALFAMACSILVPMIQKLSPHIKVLFYADDLLLYIPLPAPLATKLVARVFEVLKIYGEHVGLKLNHKKSAFILKGVWIEKHRNLLLGLGVNIKESVRYLGIQLGHVSPEEAYAPLLARMQARAIFAAHLPLSLPERVALLQQCIIPVIIFAARSYFATEEVCAKLANVYRTALRLSSWGLTLPIKELPPNEGGYLLPQPRTYLLWQHATHFVLSRHTPPPVPNLSQLHFQQWTQRFGISATLDNLPWLQLGPIPWATYPLLGTSCKAFSLLRKTAPAIRPNALQAPPPLPLAFCPL